LETGNFKGDQAETLVVGHRSINTGQLPKPAEIETMLSCLLKTRDEEPAILSITPR
jgi:hypothetical protein